MTNLREAAQMALDALEKLNKDGWILADFEDEVCASIEALRAALAQSEQEEDYDAIANKQLASLKAAAKVTFEDAVVRAVHKLYNAPPQQQEQEPVAWMEIEKYIDEDNLWDSRKILRDYDNGLGEPLYAAPPQREWVGLTLDEIFDSIHGFTRIQKYDWVATDTDIAEFAHIIEARLKAKNT